MWTILESVHGKISQTKPISMILCAALEQMESALRIFVVMCTVRFVTARSCQSRRNANSRVFNIFVAIKF